MTTIQVRASQATTDVVTADVYNVQAQDGPMREWREITPESAVAIASWWQSSGSVGSVLAAFASGVEVDRDALLGDIHKTRLHENHIGPFDSRALDCLATFIIHYGEAA